MKMEMLQPAYLGLARDTSGQNGGARAHRSGLIGAEVTRQK